MNSNRKLIILFCLLIIIISLCACDPNTRPISAKYPSRPIPMASSSVPTRTMSYIFGDSLTAQIGPAIDASEDGRVWRGEPGWTLAKFETEVRAAINSSSTRSITLALGGNDLAPSNGGWTIEDEALWLSIIDEAHVKGVCVAGVLSWFTPDVEQFWPGALSQVELSRTAMQNMPFDSLVDWKPTVETKPWIMADDGVHITSFGGTIDDAMLARYDVVSNAADGCNG